MMDVRVAIVNVALGKWYPRGSARLTESLRRHCPEYSVMPWIDRLPPGAPASVILDGCDYTGYCAKPFALRAAMNSGADIGILLDSSIVAIAHPAALVEHIASNGYYLAPAGFTIGEWASDYAVAYLGIDREAAFSLPDCASGCVGINFREARGRQLVSDWCDSWPSFAGPHSNLMTADRTHSYRNEGWVSNDRRVRGHRHDQLALSVLAHRAGMTNWVPWPKFVAYEAGFSGHATTATVFLIRGPV